MAQLNNLIVTGSSRFLNKVYFSNGGTFNGNLNVNNGNLQLYGKVALEGYDGWLRINNKINDSQPFSYGIYCESSALRTDGELQVGDGGWAFKANGSNVTCGVGLYATKGLTVSNGANIYGGLLSDSGLTVRNAGVELYFSTPFIDFHFANSNKDFTSRIIESKESVLSINGVTCSSSNLTANNVSATNVNVSSRINADAATAIFNNVYVKDELRSTTWAIDNITNLGSTFYVSPCIIFTNPSVYINSKSGTTVTLTITDNNITSSTIGGQTWTSGSKIKLMGRINTSVLGVVNGTMARQLNTSTAKTACITLNFATTDDCAGIEQGKTYSGSAIGDLKMMMYEVNLSVNGTTKNRPVGIRLSSYNEDKKSSIDIYNGTVDDGKPVARMGALDGLPTVNGAKPTGYGFYAAGNAYFNGTLVSSSGTIGGFRLSENSIQNGAFGQSGGVLICTGTNSFASIGGSNSINGWCFTAGSTFGVTNTGTLYATNANITGVINANSGKIGSFTLDNKYMQSTDETVGLSPTDVNWAFWAGGASMSTVKFRVTHAGVLYATGANISGNITATSGNIGGCAINDGKLSITNANSTYAVFEGNGKSNDYFHIATLKITGSYIDRAMVIGAQSRGYGYSEINVQFINANSADPGLNFFNQTGRGDWYIKKTATSTWNIYCKKSEVWGYTRILKYIDSPNVTLTWGSGNADLPASSTRATQLAGSSAWCYNNNSTYIDGGNIYAGTVTANAIAANSITADKITTNNIAGTNGWINLRSGTFKYNDGALAWDGSTMTIGGFKISKYKIVNDAVGMCSTAGQEWAFWAGASSGGNAPFHVGHDGSLHAENATIGGTVRAKQSLAVYNDTFATYQDVIKWDGSNLSIGLVGNAGSTGVKGAQIAFSGSQISVGNSSINCGSISGTNSSFTNVWATNFTNASTFKENITCNKNLKVKGDFTFADYYQDILPVAEVTYRRPIASASGDKSRVAILQGTSNNKIVIKAQYNSTSFTNATFTGSSSDIRLKEDIKDSSVKALSKIMQMQIREFNWKQTGVHQKLGCVADELELIDPLLTVGGGYDDDGTMNIKSIDTLLLSEYAIKGIQELYKQNKQQQKRIEYLESQLNNR